MLYFRCPTCKTILANKQLLYETKLEEICKHPKMTKIEKDEAKKALLNELELKRNCCRMRMLGYVKLIEIVK